LSSSASPAACNTAAGSRVEGIAVVLQREGWRPYHSKLWTTMIPSCSAWASSLG
jgi:hypothetical protein